MSFGLFADRKRHKGTPNTYLSDAALTIARFGLCAESPFLPKDKVCVHFQGHFSTFRNVLVWGVSQRPVYTIRVGTVRYGPHSKENLIRDKLSLVSAGRFGCEATSICFKKDFSW